MAGKRGCGPCVPGRSWAFGLCARARNLGKAGMFPSGGLAQPLHKGISSARNDSDHHLDIAFARGLARLAVQPWLGLLSHRNAGIDFAYCDHPGPGRATLGNGGSHALATRTAQNLDIAAGPPRQRAWDHAPCSGDQPDPGDHRGHCGLFRGSELTKLCILTASARAVTKGTERFDAPFACCFSAFRHRSHL